jgi:hypothetical protein
MINCFENNFKPNKMTICLSFSSLSPFHTLVWQLLTKCLSKNIYYRSVRSLHLEMDFLRKESQNHLQITVHYMFSSRI